MSSFEARVAEAHRRCNSYKAQPHEEYSLRRCPMFPIFRGSPTKSPCIPVYADTKVWITGAHGFVVCKTTVRAWNEGRVEPVAPGVYRVVPCA